MTKKLVIYTDPDCPACEDFVPRFEEAAKAFGIKYKKISVDRCPVNDVDCQTMELVPTVMYGGREIDLEKVPQFFERLSKRNRD